MNRFRIWQPFIIAVALAFGFLVGYRMSRSHADDFLKFSFGRFQKINDVINFISQEYVDTVDTDNLMDATIQDLLHSLDPHSSYIPSAELQAVNEPLEGNFDGIGIEFHVQEDTIMVVGAISGGPSEQLGIRAGDRIVEVDGKNVAGIHITNSQVMKALRGPGGTKVKVSIFRRGAPKISEFLIVRGKIPIYSVDVGYMAAPGIGYIKISHFAENTYQEFSEALQKLQQRGMKKLILDMRGNPGGYLRTAIQIADEFLPDGKLLVYTEGRSRKREEYRASEDGNFETGEVLVLIDEGSASASEIVAGALQDWDRAQIMGRRSFGKGLVQEQSEFSDGSAIRLTVARYFTPTGRCIQKPYDPENGEYENELAERVKRGELSNADSIRFSDSLKYKTPGGKVVYGGGGIMPDLFVPIDTTGISDFFSESSALGLVSQFAYDYLDKHRSDFSKFKDFDQFNGGFQINASIYSQFVQYARGNGVVAKDGVDNSQQLICNQLKALIARQLWKNDGFYPIIHLQDATFRQAVSRLTGK
ncbi:MAG: S41 family peptidase [Bacteroidota bacterium]